MLQKLQADAENIKKQVEAIAFTRSVSFSFSSVRGQKTQVIKNRTQELSMVFIPAAYSSNDRKQQHQLKHEIAVVFDAQSPSCEKALSIALAQSTKNVSTLLVIADSEQSKQHVEQLLRQYSGRGSCRIVDLSKADDALLLLQKHSPGLLVLSEDSRLFNDERVLQRMIDSLESDILLIR
jgi:flagellar biosynthesis regulator FlaF